MNLHIKRVYNKPSEGDGLRILVDRLWPRSISREKAKIDIWLKEVAPSNELRKWFNHKPERWEEFKIKYFKELESNPDAVKTILEKSYEKTVTMLYSAKDQKFNNAVALKEYIGNYYSSE